MTLARLAWHSLWNRRVSVGLTVLSLACSVMLLLGVERVRLAARTSFTSTVAGTDLVVGARTGGPQLLLQSVFNLGFPPQNLSRESYDWIRRDSAVAWVVPLSTGDIHRGFRVVGTTAGYFDHYRFAQDRGLAWAAGGQFAADDEAVLGAAVARELGYGMGEEVVVSHGAGEVSFVHHDEHPFHVVGILAPTGTPVDRIVLVPLGGMDAVHDGFSGAHEDPLTAVDPLAAALAQAEAHDHEERDHDHHDYGHHDHEHHGHDHHEMSEGHGGLSSLWVGLHQRAAALGLQRKINEHEGEALTAVLPGVALQELWSVLGVVEGALLLLGGFVVVVGLLGMLSNLLGMLDQRRREMAILRSVGARPMHILGLMVGETLMVVAAGIMLGLALLAALLAVLGPALAAHYGVWLELAWPRSGEWSLLGAVLAAGFVVGLVPAVRAYRLALLDGLAPRL